MHEVMLGHVQRGAVPGIVTLISRRGEVHVAGQQLCRHKLEESELIRAGSTGALRSSATAWPWRKVWQQ